MDPNLFKLTAVRHNERLQEAETTQHLKTAGVPKLSLQKRALLSLGSFLIASGQKSKARTQTNVAIPAFGKKL